MSGSQKVPFNAYRSTLQAISARTGTPFLSLVLSFGILHEITAIVPFVGIFYGARSLGLGERVVGGVLDSPNGGDTPTELSEGWVKRKVRTWINDGEVSAARVGSRYGIFGYEKRPPGTPFSPDIVTSHKLAGDVANAVVAYAATKALLPIRIGLSLYLAPAFSRGVLDPIRIFLVRSFRRG